MDYTAATGYVVDAQGRRQFQDRDLLNGVKGTSLIAADRNAVMNALMYLIQSVQIVPNPNDDSQVWAAVEAMIKAALIGAGGSLDFMPVQQGGGPDQTGDKVAIGNNAGDFQVLRYSINGNDAGPLISGRYGWAPDMGDLPIFSLHWSAAGRPMIGYGADLADGLAWEAVAMYSDSQAVQNNLNTEMATRADQVASLTASMGTKISGNGDSTYSDAFVSLIAYRPTYGSVYANYDGGAVRLASYDQLNTVQTNLTAFQAQQANQNSTFSSDIASRVPTNANNDGTNAPITLLNFFLETGMLWFSANGIQSNVAQTNPGDGWNAIKNITVENDDGTLTVLDTTGKTNTYQPCSANIQSDTVSVTKVGDLVIQTFEASISNANNGGAGSVVVQLPQALTEAILFTSGNALGGTQGATDWIPSVNVFPTSLTEVTIYADNLQNLNWTQAVTVKVLVVGS